VRKFFSVVVMGDRVALWMYVRSCAWPPLECAIRTTHTMQGHASFASTRAPAHVNQLA
jgi:hypothetical protein